MTDMPTIQQHLLQAATAQAVHAVMRTFAPAVDRLPAEKAHALHQLAEARADYFKEVIE